jgi:SAM-dependent methyltransferase
VIENPQAVGSEELRRRLARYRGFVRPPLTYKTRAQMALVPGFVQEHRDGRVINIGAGETDLGPNVVNVDIQPGPHVDAVGRAEALPFEDESFDAAMLIAVLEHVGDHRAALSEAHRVVKPSGRLLVEVPFLQGYHAGPTDYRRFTEAGLRRELEQAGFDVEESGVCVGPASALAWTGAEVLALLLSLGGRRTYRFALLATTWLMQPVRLLDVVLSRHPLAFVAASGVWAIGRRPSSAKLRRDGVE